MGLKKVLSYNEPVIMLSTDIMPINELEEHLDNADISRTIGTNPETLFIQLEMSHIPEERRQALQDLLNKNSDDRPRHSKHEGTTPKRNKQY